jgi:oligogalacturonide lyase
VAVDGSGVDTVWEEKRWITHVNTSPGLPNILTFCHEGPWTVVDHRIWVLNLDTCKVHKLREREHPGEAIGHEYWHADGETVGYHGHHPEQGKFFGCVKHDGTGGREAKFRHHTGHIHSNDFTMIAGDGQRGTLWVRLWRWNGEDFDGPKILCRHRSSFHTQIAHVHPRFSPDGKRVDFTSDTLGYCNVYVADIPDFDALPDVEGE